MATSIIKGTLIDELLFKTSEAIGGTTGSVQSCNWQDYDLLLISGGTYANMIQTNVIPVVYFMNTSSGSRPLIYVPYNGDYVLFELYQNGEGSIFVKSSVLNTALRIRIYGIKFK